MPGFLDVIQFMPLDVAIFVVLQLNTFSIALYHKRDVKNGFAYVLTFFSLISDGRGGVMDRLCNKI